jgi:thiosulfate/3-mercaptopyruvate sulfurtransferase
MNLSLSPLVSAKWLAARLDQPELAILDATFFMPQQARSSLAEYRSAHLPSAQFFDVDTVADAQNPLPHMLPPQEQFEQAVASMGIDNDTHVIIYDNNSFMASARVWWTFRIFGHDRVSVLDGGLRRWRHQGLPTDCEVQKPEFRRFKADFRPELVRDIDQMLETAGSTDTQIIDARPSGRFGGTEKEPRPGLRGGHIPGSFNLPFSELLEPENGCMKSPADIEDHFRSLGVTLGKPLVTTCGSGVTASILALGLYSIGVRDVAVYDGSWSEWGSRTDTPVSREAESGQ